jgi:aminopeptidase N
MRLPALAWLLVGAAVAVLSAGATAAAEPPHHEIVLTLDPTTSTIKLRDRIAVAERPDMVFRLADWLQVTELRIDGRAVTAARSGSGYKVALPTTGRHEIDVIAQGSLAPNEASGRPDHAGSDAVVSMDGIYLPGWTNWFPDTGDGKVTFKLTVETPPEFRSVATGTFVSEELTARQNSAVFSTTNAPERPSVFAGPYAVEEKVIAGVRIRTYFHKPIAQHAESYIEAAGSYIRRFEEQIGDYPFADFHIVSAPLPVGLGFPGLTYIDRRILPLPFIKDRSLAHEVLHNWWGNGVVSDYATGNWSEGLTTYLADHDLAAERDPAQAAEMRLAWLRDFAALPPERDVPVTRFVSKTHDAEQVIGYGKIALIFHMLRYELGDAVFTEGLRRLWSDWKFEQASWADLKASFEAPAGANLSWFFEQWTTRAGAPQIELADVAVSGRERSYEIVLTLTQSSPAYRLKVPVEVVTESGTLATSVTFAGARTTNTIRVGAAPVAIRIDPEHTLFRRLLPGEAPPILRDVLLDGSARSLVLHTDPGAQMLARQLAERVFDASTPPVYVEVDQARDASLLVIGPRQRIDDVLKRLGVSARPAAVDGQGNARAFVVNQADGKPALIIEAEGADDLQAMLRFLPHYRSKSFVVFDGGRVATSGVFDSTRSPLVRQLR